MTIKPNFTAGSVDVEDLRLNIPKYNGGLQSRNFRKDFKSFPYELAVKVTDLNRELTEDDKKEIIQALNEADKLPKELYPTSMKALVESIMKSGVQQPLQGFIDNGKFVAVAGNRRTCALYICKRVFDSPIKGAYVKVMERANITDRGILRAQYLENSIKADLNSIEKAELFAEMVRVWGSEESVSEECNIRLQDLRDYISLLNLSQDAQEAIKTGAFAPTGAIQLIKEVEREVGNPIIATEIVSEGIVTASRQQKAKGKNKASKKDAGKVIAENPKVKEVQEKRVKIQPVTVAELLGDIEFQIDKLDRLQKRDLSKVHKLLLEVQNIMNQA